MKKKKMFLIVTVIVFAVTCVTVVIHSTKETYTLNMLKNEADYTVIASREITKCEETDSAYVMNGYVGEKPHKENGKVYTEMYLCCSCYDTLGDKITVVTDGYYFKKDDYCFLFLKCIDKEKGLYEPINDKSGIIKGDNGKIYPMDISLKRELRNNFTDIKDFYDWFTDICNEKIQILKEQNTEPTKWIESISTTAPETTILDIQ